MNELAEKIANSTDRIAIIEHRGKTMLFYRNLNLLSYTGSDSPKNGAVWVDFHQAGRYLGLVRTWTDRNLNHWEAA